MNNKKSNTVIRILFSSAVCFIIAIACFYIFILNIPDENPVVALRLTHGCLYHGPVEFKGKMYFPSGYGSPKEGWVEVGDVVHEGAGRFERSFLNSQLYIDQNDKEYTHLNMEGDDGTRFSKAKFLEDVNRTSRLLDKFTKFDLIYHESGEDITYLIDKATIKALEEEFGMVKYYKQDFLECSEIYYIYVNASNENRRSTSEAKNRTWYDEPIEFIGCVFVVEGTMYYGNMENEIAGELANRIQKLIDEE